MKGPAHEPQSPRTPPSQEMTPIMDYLTALAADPAAWVALVTLITMEVVLGIDNVVFISILAGKLPPEQQRKARLVGLSLAMFLRIGLLFLASWIVGLTAPLFSIGSAEMLEFSGRDLILILGGLFLVYKAVTEIHEKLEGHEGQTSAGGKAVTFSGVIVQILLLDMVFSIDSVITAVGMADHVEVMVVAVVIAMIIMLVAAEPVSRFVNAHPSVNMLAPSFLLLIGMAVGRGRAALPRATRLSLLRDRLLGPGRGAESLDRECPQAAPGVAG